MTLDQALADCGLIAILRGVTPAEAVAVGTALCDAGIRVVEVPLNSPEAFVSIRLLAERFAGRLILGAGTVLDPADVALVAQAGGHIVVAPDCHVPVIARSLALGLVPFPGVYTPSEAFAAVRAGARHLKLFPAEAASPATVKAWKAVLPPAIRLYAVGGVTPETMPRWLEAGCAGFGIGSSLYKPATPPATVAAAAKTLVAAWRAARDETKR